MVAAPTLPLPLLVVSLLALTVHSHEESGHWSCNSSNSDIPIKAGFRPGIITLDGHADDWADVQGSESSLLLAVDPDEDKDYKGRKMIVKALHDGTDVFFLLQVGGDYLYSKGVSRKCPSVALVFQIGEHAAYHDERRDTCTNKTCKGAIPRRIYSGNPIDNREANRGDRFGHLVDVYVWTPHCRYLDGTGPSGSDSTAQNDWKGARWHSSFSTHSNNPYSSKGGKGTYYFKFSRPLRIMDRIQQNIWLYDVQFTIGKTSKMSAALWYPLDDKSWHGSSHYSINCDWISLDISGGGSLLGYMLYRLNKPRGHYKGKYNVADEMELKRS